MCKFLIIYASSNGYFWTSLRLKKGSQSLFYLYYFFYITILAYVVLTGYNAINQEPVFTNIEENEILPIDSILKPSYIEELKKDLPLKMEYEKYYLDSSLTIHSLANHLNTNSKYLSQLINQVFEKNFVLFVNEYRINEAKNLLSNRDNDHLTIESIGYDSGFKSKSAFNTAFKKVTGTTPSVYKKQSA